MKESKVNVEEIRAQLEGDPSLVQSIRSNEAGINFHVERKVLSGDEVRRMTEKYLIRKGDSSLLDGADSRVGLGCADDMGEIDLGVWGVWAMGDHMNNSFFWSDVVFGPRFEIERKRFDRLMQCQRDLENCLNWARGFAKTADAACVIALSETILGAVACMAGVQYLQYKAENSCWEKYAICAVSGLFAPSASPGDVRGKAFPMAGGSAVADVMPSAKIKWVAV